jgi:threonine dehydratase
MPLYYTVFPERPGATQKFLAGLESEWNVSLFHYRNHGDGKCIIMGKEIALAIHPYLASR